VVNGDLPKPVINHKRGNFFLVWISGRAGCAPALGEDPVVRVDDIPLLSALKGRLQYLNKRQNVIAENVANADVAGFTPKDVRAPTFAQLIGHSQGPGVVTLAVTDPGHIGSPGASSSDSLQMKAVDTPDSETRMDGNSVVLEEEMLKMAESRMDYDAAIGLYQHSLNMLKLAARKPGG
jgi:flagellar basal-body rod protein FlgB